MLCLERVSWGKSSPYQGGSRRVGGEAPDSISYTGLRTSLQPGSFPRTPAVFVAVSIYSLQGALLSLPVLVTAPQNETSSKEGREWPRALWLSVRPPFCGQGTLMPQQLTPRWTWQGSSLPSSLRTLRKSNDCLDFITAAISSVPAMYRGSVHHRQTQPCNSVRQVQ